MTEIKICGITSPHEVAYLLENQVDYCGVVMFYPKSKRNVDEDTAAAILAAAETIKTVAVTVSPDRQQIKRIQELGFDCIQIHGMIENTLLEQIELPVFRAYNMDLENVKNSNSDNIKVLVFDGKIPGGGESFDWSLLSGIDRGNRKLMLAGGLHAGNVAEAIKIVSPDIVDVSSAVEYGKDVVGKDPDKIREFVRKVRDNE